MEGEDEVSSVSLDANHEAESLFIDVELKCADADVEDLTDL
ncbi:hypothetical protein [Salsuginibacillus halophilus]|nr:hypothetical protein [Salsuginibacillus halophilus]